MLSSQSISDHLFEVKFSRSIKEIVFSPDTELKSKDSLGVRFALQNTV